jgi:uncharacterized protein
MKLQPDMARGTTITGYGPGWVEVNGQRHVSNLIVNALNDCSPWKPGGFETLGTDDFDIFLPMGPELILFGSGDRIRFPDPRWLQQLYARRIGVETMDTQAACRTFNFLAGEGRRVVAALLV